MHRISFQKFSLILIIVLVLIFSSRKGLMAGDFDEYVLMTVAVASHLTPDLRAEDIVRAKQLLPQHEARFRALSDGMQTQTPVPKYGYYRASNGDVFASHFFAYSALAAIPYIFFEKIGVDPTESFYILNLACIFILGLCLYKFFGVAWKAAFGLLLFSLCGGLNYFLWSSPECMSAAFLLSGLILFSLEAPIIAGLLIGLASTQNPPIVFALGFAPLFKALISTNLEESLLTRLKAALSKRMFLGIFLGACLFLIPIGFNLWAFDVHSVIARDSTSFSLASWVRLHSYFFDLSQGMVIGVLGIWLGLVWHLFAAPSKDKRRAVLFFILASVLSCLFAFASLVAGNWNSAAIGMMRYAFWGAMPFLFVFLVFLREQIVLNRKLLFGCILIQVSCVASAAQYRYLDHSPLAKLVFARSASLYNPEPEIFVERTLHQDGIALDKTAFYTFNYNGKPVKTLFHIENKNLDHQLCGDIRIVERNLHSTNAGDGWFYLNGPLICNRIN